MKDIKMLKVMLVAVFVIGVAFSGYNAYQYQALKDRVVSFNEQILGSTTDEAAKLAVQDFIISTDDNMLAMSASADNNVLTTKPNPTCPADLRGCQKKLEQLEKLQLACASNTKGSSDQQSKKNKVFQQKLCPRLIAAKQAELENYIKLYKNGLFRKKADNQQNNTISNSNTDQTNPLQGNPNTNISTGTNGGNSATGDSGGRLWIISGGLGDFNGGVGTGRTRNGE